VVEDVVVKKFTFAISSPDEFLVVCCGPLCVVLNLFVVASVSGDQWVNA